VRRLPFSVTSEWKISDGSLGEKAGSKTTCSWCRRYCWGDCNKDADTDRYTSWQGLRNWIQKQVRGLYCILNTRILHASLSCVLFFARYGHLGRHVSPVHLRVSFSELLNRFQLNLVWGWGFCIKKLLDEFTFSILHESRLQENTFSLSLSRSRKAYGTKSWYMIQSSDTRGCIQKFPDWPPGARTANGTVLYY